MYGFFLVVLWSDYFLSGGCVDMEMQSKGKGRELWQE